MILLKTALSSLLFLLVGCDHSGPSAEVAVPSAVVSATETTPAPTPTVAQHESAVSPGASSAARVPEVAPKGNRVLKQVARIAYVCPMHPEVVSDAPGLCPKCNMKLEPKPAAEAPRSHAGHDHAEDGQ